MRFSLVIAMAALIPGAAVAQATATATPAAQPATQAAAGPSPATQASWLRTLAPVAGCTVTTYADALACFTTAAQAGDAVATNHLGLMARDGRGVPRDPALAVQRFETAGKAGFARAWFSAGYMYHYGNGVARDYAIAARYYGLGAAAGDSWSMTSLGYFLNNGLGVPLDTTAGLAMYEKAAALGNVTALRNLAAVYNIGKTAPRDYPRAVEYLKKAVALGDFEAVYRLGNAYKNGWGVEKDLAQAILLYQQAAAKNIDGAQLALGRLYASGQGVPKDAARAKTLFDQAARRGNGEALFQLGLVYRDGLDGLPPNPAIANVYFQQAVAAGYAKAQPFITPTRAVGDGDAMLVADPAFQRRSLTGAAVPTGPRLALVIGNSNYAPNFSTLANPGRDANRVAAALGKAGFKVTLKQDLDLGGMKTALADFVDAVGAAGPNTTALFYYAGHGAAAEGVNYLLPVGQPIRNLTGLRAFGQSAQDIIALLGSAKPTTAIVILDACRNVPFPDARGGVGGLVQMNALNGTIIAFSTAPGQVATDGAGDNSPYASTLADLIQQSNDPVELVFRKVRRQVLELTDNEQTPWESTSLVSDFSFLPR